MNWIIASEKTKEGRFLYDAAAYNQAIYEAPVGKLEMLIGPPHKDLSGKERRYYWPIAVTMWADFYGDTMLNAHEFLLAQCAPRDGKGRIIRTGRRQKRDSDIFSDTPQDHRQFHEYVFGFRGCRAFMASEGCPTPDPEKIKI